jgi:diacylglycerol kinase
MERKKFSWKKRAKSFLYAWQGLKALLRTEHNSRIHLALTGVAAALLCLLPVNRTELMVVLMAACLVWMAELFNTAIEKTADLVSKERHPQIRAVKDMAAAAVLMAAAAAVVVGLLIFLPKIILTCKSI